MQKENPTFRERAIDTAANNQGAMRDLIVDLATKIDELLDVPQIRSYLNFKPPTPDKPTPE